MVLEILNKETVVLKDKLIEIYAAAQRFREENGQDLVEYALTVALIALAATAGMNTLAHDINNAFSAVGSTLVSYAT
jgi:pilus assembly protein Flp/PilA